MSVMFAEKLKRIPHYEAGIDIDEARRRFEVKDVVKLASNESPFPPVPEVVEAVAQASRELNRYPDAAAFGLRGALADRFGISSGRIAVGNGSCEILLAAAEALCDPDSEIVYAWPSFSMYPHLPALSSSEAVTVPLADGQVHDLEAMATAVSDRTRLLIVCNPNNPTGTCLPSERIGEMLEILPSWLMVVVDQAYIEFQVVEDPDESLDLIERFPNLVLLRTFSKVYGLGGLRIGYALGSAEFREAVDSVRQPFSVNRLAQTAATEALRHTDDVIRRVERNAIERLWVEEKLAELGLETTDTQTNFSWISLGDLSESQVFEGLIKRGLIVRPGAALGAEGNLRVTFGTRPENERFIQALGEVIAESR